MSIKNLFDLEFEFCKVRNKFLSIREVNHSELSFITLVAMYNGCTLSFVEETIFQDEIIKRDFSQCESYSILQNYFLEMKKGELEK